MPALPLLLLCCPACHGELSAEGPEAIRCRACGRLYAIVDGIPLLIASAVPAESPEK